MSWQDSNFIVVCLSICPTNTIIAIATNIDNFITNIQYQYW